MNARDLTAITTKARERMKLIKERYPTFSAELVFAGPRGMVRPSESPAEILQVFEDFFLATPERLVVQDLLKRKKDLEKQRTRESERKSSKKSILELGRDIEALATAIDSASWALEVDPEVRVEIRWVELDFEIMRALRGDAALVDVARTPQIGGIRVVLGTLGSFA